MFALLVSKYTCLIGSSMKIELCDSENPLNVFLLGEIGITIFYNFKMKGCKSIITGNNFFWPLLFGLLRSGKLF